MTPAAKTTASVGKLAVSLAYAEAFVPESEHARAARDAADAMGVTSVSSGTASVLTFLTRVINASHVVEIGTGCGVSALALLEGMRHDGVLTSIDTESEHQAAARRALTDAGVPARRARLIVGNALSVLDKLSDRAYDVVLLDGDPLEYVEYVEQASRLLRHGGLLVLHHALAGGAVADPTNEDDETVIIREALEATQTMEEFSPVLLPVGDGLLVAIRS